MSLIRRRFFLKVCTLPGVSMRKTLLRPATVTIPGTRYTGNLYSTCDENLNAELPLGHPANTYVPTNIWREVNYILNHRAGVFYWDVQAPSIPLSVHGLPLILSRVISTYPDQSRFGHRLPCVLRAWQRG